MEELNLKHDLGENLIDARKIQSEEVGEVTA